MNNKILLTLNIVLLIAVIVLFTLVFQLKSAVGTSPKDGKDIAKSEGPAHANDADTKIKIAYFELDSLSNNYTYYKNIRKSLSNRENQIQSQLTTLRNNMINKAQYYQEKGANMTQNEQIAAQQDMQKLQQNYQMKEQELTQQFHDETNKKLLDVRTRIMKFLDGFARERGYAYVVATSEDDNIFYFKDSLRNITPELVNGLNSIDKAAEKPRK
ncbi:MAG: OmpH family outer membrane protein [Chitinophagaceae bacterium]